MFNLRKSAEAFFDFMEKNEEKKLSETSLDELGLVLYLKNGGHLTLSPTAKDDGDKDNVVPLRKQFKRVSP
jgi:hypothetical protein